MTLRCERCGLVAAMCTCEDGPWQAMPVFDSRAPQLHVLPKTGFAPSNAEVAAHLRETADNIAADDSAEVRSVQVIIEYADGTLDRNVCGGPQDVARGLGVLAMALLKGAFE